MFKTTRHSHPGFDHPGKRPATRFGYTGATAALALALVLASCGSSESTQDTTATSESVAAGSAETPATDGAGLRLVSAETAADIIASPPENLVILDVRTPEEFAEGHIEGAIMLDFYRDDFADELAKLDPSVPYVLYCRSGNRSGQTISLMEGFGFADVADVDGGIGGWLGAGLPVVVP